MKISSNQHSYKQTSLIKFNQEVRRTYNLDSIKNFLSNVAHLKLVSQIQKINPLLLKLEERKQMKFKYFNKVPQQQYYQKQKQLQPKIEVQIIISRAPQLIQKLPKQKDPLCEFKKELKFRLNQLAPENSAVILKHIYKLIADNNQFIHIVPQMIIEFGMQSLKYRQQYAKLCEELMGQLEENNLCQLSAYLEKELIQQLNKNFKILCQTELEMQDNEEYTTAKNKITSQIRFLGDVYIFNNLNQKIVNNVIVRLLKKYLNVTFSGGDGELYLDMIVEFLEECGQVFEYRFQSDTKKEDKYYELIKEIILRKQIDLIQEITEVEFSCQLIIDILILITLKMKVSQRIKILIENLEERSQNDWECTINQNYQKVYELEEENYDSAAETNSIDSKH